MYLKKLSLFNYKNHLNGQFEFTERLNCITGRNGSGKTNLLDAIYFLALTKSAVSSQLADCIKFHEKFASLKGDFLGMEEFTVIANLFPDKPKVLKLDDDVYSRVSDHIGKVPLIWVEPHDVDYVRLGSEQRRKLFDGFITQIDSDYLSYIIRYNRLLRNRNQTLKDFAERKTVDHVLLDSYDVTMIELSKHIYERRKFFVDSFRNDFEKMYMELADQQEKVAINYLSILDQADFEKTLKDNRMKDIQASRSTVGIHRDDYEFLFADSGMPVKSHGSQGQQKTFILALKLSQIKLFRDHLNTKPILLLDDIFDKLDSVRIERLLKFVTSQKIQVFLTDARKERTEHLLKEMNIKATKTDLTK